MSNVCLKIYLSEKQRHHGILLYEWLLNEAQRVGIKGGSVFRSIAGFGRHGQLHDVSFFELAGELPVQVEFVLDKTLADNFLEALRKQKLSLFYACYPVESGFL
jgi:uncharacterized protein